MVHSVAGGGRRKGPGPVLPLEQCPAAISSTIFRANRRSPIWLDSRILLLLLAHLPMRDPGPQFSLPFIPFFPLPCRVVEPVGLLFPSVSCVCVCVRVRACGQLKLNAPPSVKGEKRTSATCLIAAPAPAPKNPGPPPLTTHRPARPTLIAVLQCSAVHLTSPAQVDSGRLQVLTAPRPPTQDRSQSQKPLGRTPITPRPPLSR